MNARASIAIGVITGALCAYVALKWRERDVEVGASSALAGGAMGASAFGGGGHGAGGCSSATSPPCSVPFAVPKFQGGWRVHGSGQSLETLSETGLTTVLDWEGLSTSVSGTSLVFTTGGTWARVGASGLTTDLASPFTDPNARSVAYGLVPGSAAPDTTTGDIATEDFYLEWWGYTHAVGAIQDLIIKHDGTTGIKLQVSAANVVQAVVNGTTVSSGYTEDATGSWNKWAIGCIHDGSANSLRVYQNDTMVASGVCPAATSTNSATMTIGRKSDAAAEPCDCMVSLVRMWKAPTTTFTTTTLDTLAINHFSQVTGFKAERAVSGSEYPVAAQRRATRKVCDIQREDIGTAATTSKAQLRSRMFRVGPGWDCLIRRNDRSRGSSEMGGEYAIGFFPEDVGINLAKNSNNVNAASWGFIDGTAGDSNLANAQDTPMELAAGLGAGTAFEGTIVRGGADAGGAKEHGVRQATTNTLSAGVHIISIFAEYKSDETTVARYVWLRDNTVGATAIAWFDVDACQVGTVGAGVHAYVSPPMNGGSATRAAARATFFGDFSGNRWCRIEMAIDGTAATHSIDVGFSRVDGTSTCTVALANDRLGVLWGAQVEKVVEGHGASSLIVTPSTSSVQRDFDDLRYPGANIPASGGTLAWAEMLPRSTTSQAAGNINSAGYVCTPRLDANNVLVVKNNPNNVGHGLVGVAQTESAGNTPFATFLVGGVAQVDCCGNSPSGQWYGPPGRNMTDGKRHHVRAVWMPNDFRVYADADETPGIVDTSVTVGDLSAGQLVIGFDVDTSALHGDGVIEDCLLYADHDIRPVWP